MQKTKTLNKEWKQSRKQLARHANKCLPEHQGMQRVKGGGLFWDQPTDRCLPCGPLRLVPAPNESEINFAQHDTSVPHGPLNIHPGCSFLRRMTTRQWTMNIVCVEPWKWQVSPREKQRAFKCSLQTDLLPCYQSQKDVELVRSSSEARVAVPPKRMVARILSTSKKNQEQPLKCKFVCGIEKGERRESRRQDEKIRESRNRTNTMVDYY